MISIVYVQQQKMMKQIQAITKVSHYFSLCLTELTNYTQRVYMNIACMLNVMLFDDNNNKYVWHEHLNSKDRKVTKAKIKSKVKQILRREMFMCVFTFVCILPFFT